MKQPSPGLRAIATSAFFCMFMGTCGIGNSLPMLSARTPQPQVELPPGTRGNAELFTAAERFWTAMADVQAGFAARRLIEAANIAVSVLLIVAAFNLMRRSKSAVWWTTQAAIANGLHALASGVANAWHLRANARGLGRAFDALTAAERAATPQAMPDGASLDGAGMMRMVATAMIVFAIAEALIYAALARRIRKPDVAQALAEPLREE